MDFPFLKEETFGLRTQETFVGNRCEIYLPSYYINKGDTAAFATDLGDRIESIGLFYFNVDGKLYELTLPIKFQFQFSDVQKKRFKLKPEIPEMEYYVYILNRGDAFVYNILHKKSVDDIQYFIAKMVENAKLPAFISYNDALDVFMKAMTSSTFIGLGVSAVSIEFILSELYRNKKKMNDPFRLAYNGNNEYDYKMINIRKVPQLNSTFTSLIGEDINTQLISSILRTREHAEEKESPIEKIIKY